MPPSDQDKLARFLVIAYGVLGALEPELMERIADETGTTDLGRDWRIVARVDAARGWEAETKAA